MSEISDLIDRLATEKRKELPNIFQILIKELSSSRRENRKDKLQVSRELPQDEFSKTLDIVKNGVPFGKIHDKQVDGEISFTLFGEFGEADVKLTLKK